MLYPSVKCREIIEKVLKRNHHLKNPVGKIEVVVKRAR
jgi:hypothetical protein